jgi:predicted regulator of Ras-like GTPase activity (Roadblock/LC7/MglB family)
MSINEILLEALERVHGAQLAGIVGTDGLGVEMTLAEGMPFEREEIEVELAALTSSAAITAGRLGGGAVRDIIVEADEVTFLASMITPGYYAVLGVMANGSLGRARFAVHQMVSRLQNEL